MYETAKVIQKCCRPRSSEKLKVETLLHYVGHGHLSLHSLKILSSGMSVQVPDADETRQHSLSSVLFYISDGFLPMMVACCQKLAAWNKPNRVSKAANEIHIKELQHVANAIVVCNTQQTYQSIL